VKISSYQHGKATVVSPRDAIVESDCADLRHAVAQAIANGSSQIVIDLAEVPFIDSAGLELFCELQTTCAESGAHLKLASLDETCAEILHITDLDFRFHTFQTVEESIKGLA